MKKRVDIKKEYKKAWKYLKESKKFIYAIIILFFIFALIGFFVPPPESLANQIIEFIKELIEKTKDMSMGELIGFIFLNNIKSSFYGMILGVFIGFFPFIYTLANGYLLGFVSSMVVKEEGILTMWRLFPHGIFELPAAFISFALGLKIGSFILQKKKLDKLKEFLLNSLRVFLLVVIPLLLIAGIIEGVLIFVSG